MKPAQNQFGRKSISETFAQLREGKRIGLMPFLPAGYPDLATTAEVLLGVERAGASLIEIGIPFSDPIADGPTIQTAFTAALGKGLRIADVLATVRGIRGSLSVPLVAMVSYSIIFRYGQDRFFADFKAAGFDGIVLPDVTPPEAQNVVAAARSAGLETTLLVAPTTPPERREEIVELCSGFVYYLSVSGTTGERTALPADLADNLQRLRAITDKPICVGFGISRPEHVAQLCGRADGAIVGSALVNAMSQSAARGAKEIAAVAEAYCRSLLA